MRYTARSRRLVPSLERLHERLTPSGALPLLSPMDAIMLGPPDPPPTDVLLSPMDAIMLGPPDPPPTDVVPGPTGPVMLGPDVTAPTSTAVPPVNPVMLACPTSALTPAGPTAMPAPMVPTVVTVMYS